jgi:hypothetical protein
MLTFKQFLLEAENAETIFQSVIKHFTATKNIKQGIWMLPDGQMVDQSGGRAHGLKVYDHPDVVEGFPESMQNMPDGKVEEFFKDLGAIRMAHYGSGTIYGLINMNVKPTLNQYNVIKRIKSGFGLLHVEAISKQFGRMYYEYGEKDTENKVVHDLKVFYKDGTTPRVSSLAGFR